MTLTRTDASLHCFLTRAHSTTCPTPLTPALHAALCFHDSVTVADGHHITAFKIVKINSESHMEGERVGREMLEGGVEAGRELKEPE